jgi:hypothetical protein
MITEPVKTTIQYAETFQTWATVDAWAKTLGVSEHDLQSCLEGLPSRPIWVQLEEFTYIDQAYESETVAQACESLLSTEDTLQDFTLASDEVLRQARTLSGEVQERVNRVLRIDNPVNEDGRNRITEFLPG